MKQTKVSTKATPQSLTRQFAVQWKTLLGFLTFVVAIAISLSVAANNV